jgi:hypothetical protein
MGTPRADLGYWRWWRRVTIGDTQELRIGSVEKLTQQASNEPISLDEASGNTEYRILTKWFT